MERSIELKLVSKDDGEEVYNMLQHIAPGMHAFNNEVYGMKYEEYIKWLEKMVDWSNGENLPEGYVQQYTYWLIIEGEPVGYGKLRSALTEESKKFGGNIGYAISDEYRGKGYGTLLLKEILKEAERHGIEERLITVEKFNYPSKKVAESCGAKLTHETENRWFFKI